MNNQRRAGVILSYLSAGLAMVISLLYTPLMLRLLGQSEYGVYQAALAFISYLSLLQFGLNNAFTHFHARYVTAGDQDGLKKLNGLYLTFYLIIAGLSLIIGAIIVKAVPVLMSKFNAEEIAKAKILMRILVVNTALTFPVTLFNNNIVASERYIFARIMTILKQVASPLLAIPMLLLGFNSVGIVATSVFITVVTGLAEGIYCKKELHIGFLFGKIDRDLIREILVFTGFIFLTTIAIQINWSLDRIVLANTVGSAAVAIYSVASQLDQYYSSMAATVSDVFTPKVHRMAAEGATDRDFTNLFTSVGRVQFLIVAMIMLGFVVFGRDFIAKWAGTEYVHTDAWLCGVLLFIADFVGNIQYIGVSIQQAKNLHKFRSFVFLGEVLVNIGLSVPLSLKWGPLGAVFGTLFVTTVGHGIIMNVYYKKKIGIDIGYFWKEILSMCRGLLLPAAFGAVVLLFVDTSSWLRMALWGVLFVAVYAVSMWLVAMNDSEKDLVRVPLRKFKSGFIR